MTSAWFLTTEGMVQALGVQSALTVVSRAVANVDGVAARRHTQADLDGGTAKVVDSVWERIDVSTWQVQQVEAAGSNKVEWLKHPDTGEPWLHKYIHVPTNGVPQGEDWAEVVTTQVAKLLAVPCAVTRLCWRDESRGSISRSVIPQGCDLNEGGVVLGTAGVKGYFRQTDSRKVRDPKRPDVERPGHTLANIKSALQGMKPPEGFQGPEGCTGFDIFVGFTILDALVANRDRHEQNWAVLRPRLTDQPERLAPSFDHGGSLGYNLRDEKRTRCLEDLKQLERWAERGTAYRFEHEGTPPSLVEHAVTAIGLATDVGAEWWRGRLDSLDLAPVHAALKDGISEMSPVAATFASKLLDINLRRLRDAISGCR